MVSGIRSWRSGFPWPLQKLSADIRNHDQCWYQSGWRRRPDRRNQRRLTHYQGHVYARLISFELEQDIQFSS
jgi:hypothetical protein